MQLLHAELATHPEGVYRVSSLFLAILAPNLPNHGSVRIQGFDLIALHMHFGCPSPNNNSDVTRSDHYEHEPSVQEDVVSVD